MNEQRGLAIGARHITVSTCGLVDGIKNTPRKGSRSTSRFRLHAPNDEIRKRLMPIAQRYSMDELLDAVRYYIDKAGRRVTFEYIMIKGINDSLECAEELAEFAQGHSLLREPDSL
jgi:23S rRNA (adenine2503-C2)-methyltransferase